MAHLMAKPIFRPEQPIPRYLAPVDVLTLSETEKLGEVQIFASGQAFVPRELWRFRRLIGLCLPFHRAEQ
jgi:hypothetical protein